ncbi:MAG: GNAT family N-acetyltransferase [Chloroflexota bacterium]
MTRDWTIRPFDEERDAPLRARVAQRLNPGATVSPRDPGELDRYFEAYARGERGTEGDTFVAHGPDGAAAGLLSLFSEPDYFTGHLRAYVAFLAVDEVAEGRGAGRALMAHAERWAQEHGCKEVCLDVWAGNARAIAFYERLGFLPDHIRMARPLAGNNPA